MIRKFLSVTSSAKGGTISCKIAADDSFGYTWSTAANPVFYPSENTFTEHLTWMLSQGWKEVTSGIDPNDLQATCDHRKYDIATDSCQICGKDWNTILWMGKPCCNGGGNGPAQYVGGKWHSSDCDTLKPPLGLPEAPSTSIDYRPKPSYRCQCGAQATSNPNCHSTWCPDYKK